MFWFVSLFFALQVCAAEPGVDLYTEKIQPLFNHRCVACHSCLNAPCQLNLQNYEGFVRGANKFNVYNGTRIDAVPPTRLWIDAHTPGEWQQKGFYPVNTSTDPANNLFFQIIAAKATEKTPPTKVVRESQSCPATASEPKVAMPYALPGLPPDEMKTLETWILQGAPGPQAAALKAETEIPVESKKQVREWEAFFNQKDLRHRIVSRYLYEHLYLAHLYFTGEPGSFFRLVRSRTPCENDVAEIATRRPNDNPGVEDFYYCFKKFPGTVVAKTHIPYELTPAKKQHLEDLFFKDPWKATRLPSYNYQEAENPFLVFKDLPVKARYEFLLEDAQYHISTFIKGPVCNGSAAVNSIQEQFFVFFLQPGSDLMVRSPGFQDQAQNLLILPGVWGSDIKLDNTPAFLSKLIEHREQYRQLRARWKKELFPKGYALGDLWNGGGENPNAVLTVFRHDDNAVVLKGAVGDLPKTVFILDYPLFERLVYNLVVNFDVYGNVGHQLLTRIYMDLIRMEAEEIFLSFLPPEERLPLRASWYQGLATRIKMDSLYPVVERDLPTAVPYSSGKNAKKEFVEKVLFTHLNGKVRGPIDPINWKKLQAPEGLSLKASTRSTENLREIAAVPAEDKSPFAKFFPDLSLLLVREKGGRFKVFSLIHNREHQNISWILAENLRMAPQEDTLTIREGIGGAYPNMFFTVNEDQMAAFTKQILKIKSAKDASALIKEYGVLRTQERFWRVYDELNTHFQHTAPVEFGYLDLTRYEM